MKITLNATDTLSGVAGTASAVTYTFLGDDVVSGIDSFGGLPQGQLPSSVGTIWSATAGQSLVTIIFANTTGSDVTSIKIFKNGTAATNQVTGTFTIPANGTATLDGLTLNTYDNAGRLVLTSNVTLTGDVTGSGSGSIVTTITNDAVTNAKLANVSTATFKGRTTAGTGDPEDLTATQATAILNVATTSLKGLQSAIDKLKEDGAYKDIVAEFGADPTGSVDATTIIQTAHDSFSSAGGRLFFPTGTYKISGTITISKPIIFCGAARSISVISTTSATANMFDMAAGAQGAGFEQIRLIGATAGTRTAGFAVNFGTQSNVYMQQCDILFQWSGVHSSGALQFLDDMNIREGGQNAASGAAVLVDSTGDRYIRRLTTDQTNVSTYAGIRVRECSSLVITDSNIIHSGSALDIVPNAGVGHAVASVDAVNCFFDTSTIGANIVPTSANDTAQRITFIRCWFGTHVTAGAVIGHANANAIDFIGCEFYQSPVGLDVTAATDWSVRASRICGNTTAGIRVAANSTNRFSITDNFIGNGAGFGANALGINIQAGTYNGYAITDNRGLDTNTTPGITDNGTVNAPNEKSIRDNLGLGINYYVRATASQLVNSTVLADVTGLVFPLVQPNLKYAFNVFMPINLGATAATGLSVAINCPTSASLNAMVNVINTVASQCKNVYFTQVNTAQSAIIITTGQTLGVFIQGVVIAGTATSHTGNVVVRLSAQSSAVSTTAGSATVNLGSFLQALKV